jgi:hypothetical protein
MTQWTVNFVAAVSLVLAILVGALWGTAQRRWLRVGVVTEHPLNDSFTGSAAGGEQGTNVRRRGLNFAADRLYIEVEETSRVFETRPPVPLMRPGQRAFHFRSGTLDDNSQSLDGELSGPSDPPDVRADLHLSGNDVLAELRYWPLLLALCILPATWLSIHCGYDLRATADRCPECGRLAPPS